VPDTPHVEESEVLEQIRRIVATELGVRAVVTPETSLVGGLKLDSLSAITLAVALEDRYRIQLGEQDAGELSTVRDLVALVRRRIAERSAEAGSPC
jgi:acyl carrier protein